MSHKDGKEKYFRFMEEVAREYEDMGALVNIDLEINGQNIDVLVKQGLPDGSTIRIAVECKDKKIGIRDVEKFSSIVNDLKGSHEIDCATMISSLGYSINAQTNASARNIHLITIEDLKYRLSDFRNFTVNYIDEQRRISYIGGEEFIPLKGTLLSGKSIGNIIEFLFDWLAGSENQLLLLGEGGAGKTTLCHKFSLLLAESFLDGDGARIPLCAELKFSDPRGKITNILASFLDVQGIKIIPNRISQLIRSGRICLILDGFDEFELANIQQQVARDFRDLDVCIGPKTKILISCRSGFFRSKQDMFTYEIGTDKFRLIPPGRDDLVLNINALNALFVKKQLSRFKLIKEVYGDNLPQWLFELFTRPIHLRMIMSMLKSEEKPTRENLSKLKSRSDLYELYMDHLFNWDCQRSGSVFKDKIARRCIYESLAVELLIAGSLQINEDFIEKAFLRAAIAKDQRNIGAERDILNGILLQRSPQGVTWEHKTYGEFLGASYVTNLIVRDERDFDMIWFTRDERAFIIEMISEKEIETLYKWLEGDDYEPIQFAAFIFGGTQESKVIEKLAKVADRSRDLLTQINCLNSLGFLNQKNVVNQLLAIVIGYLKYRNLSHEKPPFISDSEFTVDQFSHLEKNIGPAALIIHIRETMDALSRIGNSNIIPFLRCVLMDNDKTLVAEVKECIRRLDSKN